MAKWGSKKRSHSKKKRTTAYTVERVHVHIGQLGCSRNLRRLVMTKIIRNTCHLPNNNNRILHNFTNMSCFERIWHFKARWRDTRKMLQTLSITLLTSTPGWLLYDLSLLLRQFTSPLFCTWKLYPHVPCPSLSSSQRPVDDAVASPLCGH